MRGLPPVTIRTAERRFRSGPNLLSDLKILAVDGLAPKWFSSSTTQDSMGIEWMTVIYQRWDQTAYYVRGSLSSELSRFISLSPWALLYPYRPPWACPYRPLSPWPCLCRQPCPYRRHSCLWRAPYLYQRPCPCPLPCPYPWLWPSAAAWLLCLLPWIRRCRHPGCRNH